MSLLASPVASATTPPVTHLLYLHGFRSSPRSAKAQHMAEVMRRAHPEVRWWCPQLPPSPREAMALVSEGIADWPSERMGVVGSSLGGFYATAVAQATGCRAALINPAVHPARDLARYIGEQTFWHDPDAHFFFRADYVEALRALDAGALEHPQRFLVFIAKGDEVLDWREMAARYAGAQIELIEGGDHALSDFPARLPRLMKHFGLA
ncbi:MAG: alpha/beta fold hydrolase [Tibeticola sp.]